MITIQKAVHHYDTETAVPLPDLELEDGDELLVIGLSGSGKSTLLHVLAGILRPTTGSYRFNDLNLYDLKESELDTFRGRNIGIIFQETHLIDSLTVFDNLKLAGYMSDMKISEKRIYEVCGDLEITDQLKSYPDQLSRGQKQRVGIARAVMNDPVLLLADEPTSSLDDKRSENVISLLKMEAKKTSATLVISTHDQRVKEHFSNIIEIKETNQTNPDR